MMRSSQTRGFAAAVGCGLRGEGRRDCLRDSAELYGTDEDCELRTLLPYFWSLYSDPSALYYGDDYIFSSREGCQQGCTLGSLLYVLSVSSVINPVRGGDVREDGRGGAAGCAHPWVGGGGGVCATPLACALLC